ncbi:MAG: DUF5989 family protein [Candidatus Pacearchaeota archaeon]
MSNLIKYLLKNKWWWLTPIIVMLIIVIFLMIFVKNSALNPFIYSLG